MITAEEARELYIPLTITEDDIPWDMIDMHIQRKAIHRNYAYIMYEHLIPDDSLENRSYKEIRDMENVIFELVKDRLSNNGFIVQRSGEHRMVVRWGEVESQITQHQHNTCGPFMWEVAKGVVYVFGSLGVYKLLQWIFN